jgi:predicted ABC-type ATPase
MSLQSYDPSVRTKLMVLAHLQMHSLRLRATLLSELRALGDAKGHEFHGNQWKDEAGKQEKLAEAQTNPLAHPQFVVGGSSDPATLRYVAAYGQEFNSAKLPEDVPRGTPKECYKNASILVLEREDLTYAEGFAKTATLGDMTFQHAWAVDKTGNVVDPTWDHPEKNTYFGVKYNRESYLKYLYTAKIYGVLGSTRKNAQEAVRTGGKKLREPLSKKRALGDAAGHEFHGNQWTHGGESMIGKPASHYEPSRPDGLDTRERFSDGKGNYTPEREKLHDEIVAKYMAGTTPVERPTAVILGGAPGVGKSTAVQREGIGKENTVVVNPDEIRNDLPEYAADASGRRPASTAFTHEEASDISAKLVKEASSNHRNVVLDGTGDSSIEKLGGKVAVLRSRGASIEGTYVTTSVEVSQARANKRGERIGRMVPPTAMREMHHAVSKVFPEAVRQGLFDHAKLFDSTNGHTLVASSKGRELTIHDQGLWNAFIAKGK